MLETLAGPVPVSEGLAIAIQSLRRGLRAEEVALITLPADQPARRRANTGPFGANPSSATPTQGDIAGTALASVDPDGAARLKKNKRVSQKKVTTEIK